MVTVRRRVQDIRPGSIRREQSRLTGASFATEGVTFRPGVLIIKLLPTRGASNRILGANILSFKGMARNDVSGEVHGVSGSAECFDGGVTL